ncbi:MAG: 50S ribosomal protein L34e, partial [Candidatus Diapherotrites archaeon]|nr:50S ribosomal protein L34e [Candidatus Diapherotrites archaeon]
MTKPADRVRSRKKMQVRRKAGTKNQFKAERVSKAKCALCSGTVHGVPMLGPSAMRQVAKSSRRPEVPFGGHLCNTCRK